MTDWITTILWILQKLHEASFQSKKEIAISLKSFYHERSSRGGNIVAIELRAFKYLPQSQVKNATFFHSNICTDFSKIQNDCVTFFSYKLHSWSSLCKLHSFMQFEEEKINKNQTNPRHNTNFRKKLKIYKNFNYF